MTYKIKSILSTLYIKVCWALIWDISDLKHYMQDRRKPNTEMKDDMHIVIEERSLLFQMQISGSKLFRKSTQISILNTSWMMDLMSMNSRSYAKYYFRKEQWSGDGFPLSPFNLHGSEKSDSFLPLWISSFFCKWTKLPAFLFSVHSNSSLVVHLNWLFTCVWNSFSL